MTQKRDEEYCRERRKLYILGYISVEFTSDLAKVMDVSLAGIGLIPFLVLLKSSKENVLD